MTNLSELAVGFRTARQMIEGAMAAVNTARERHEEALRRIAMVSDGSTDDNISMALGNIAQVDERLDESLSLYAAAEGQLELYVHANKLQ